jgi:ADP-ribosylglycohydrolase
MDSGDPLAARFVAVVVGSRVGDAMGTPTEALTPAEIEDRFGWVTGFTGDGTDDSLMATLLAGALLAAGARAGADEWADQLVAHREEILAKRDKFFPSVLHLVEKLAAGYPPSQVAAGTMPSTSSAMCIWPVGLLHAGDPAGAAAQAYRLAGLIHTGEVDFCTDAAAAVAAAVAAGLRPGATVDDAIGAALAAIRPRSGERMRGLITDALELADGCEGYRDFRARYAERFQRPIFCDSRETVPAALALTVLARGDLPTAVAYGANFGRDTDTVAAMAGAVCGALGGVESVPPQWWATIGEPAAASAWELARRLAGAARRRAADQVAAARAVPGLLLRTGGPAGA